MTHAKFHFNCLMLTSIFGIWASEPPPGPGERLKRPGLIGLNINVVECTLSCIVPTPLAILSGKKDEAELASIGKASNYSKISILLRHKDRIS